MAGARVRLLSAPLAVLAGHPLLRAIIVESVPISFSTSGFLAIYVRYATRELALGPATIGLIFAAGGVGAVSGAMLARWAADRSGVGSAMIGGWVLAAAGTPLVPLAAGPAVVVVALLAVCKAFEGITDTVANIHQWSLRQVVTPDHRAGRVTAATASPCTAPAPPARAPAARSAAWWACGRRC